MLQELKMCPKIIYEVLINSYDYLSYVFLKFAPCMGNKRKSSWDKYERGAKVWLQSYLTSR